MSTSVQEEQEQETLSTSNRAPKLLEESKASGRHPLPAGAAAAAVAAMEAINGGEVGRGAWRYYTLP